MKRLAKISIVFLLILLMSPLTSFAAPQGYMEVEITKKNFKKYLEIKKVKLLDSFGDYDGYAYAVYPKLLKNGYHVYDTTGFAAKVTCKVSSKWKKDKTESYKTKCNMNRIGLNWYFGDSGWKFKSGKMSNIKIKKAKGTIIFIEPSNIIGMEEEHNKDGKLTGYKVKLRYPYDDNTGYETKYNEATQQWERIYYYKYLYLDSGCPTLLR